VLDRRGFLVLDHPDIVRRLKIHPERRRGAKVARKSHGSIYGDASPTVDDVADSGRGDPQLRRKTVPTAMLDNRGYGIGERRRRMAD
jgi:hypothetical protein